VFTPKIRKYREWLLKNSSKPIPKDIQSHFPSSGSATVTASVQALFLGLPKIRS